jgi:serine/threonine-protein kinase
VISWVGPLILMFAAIVPTPPRKMLVAGFVAASMDPAGMWVAQLAGGHPIVNVTDALIMHLGSYLMAGIAVVISHVVTRLGREVGKARELGSYLLGDLIGQGGMGQVYRATHRLLARPAAIKLIRPEAMNAGSGESAPTAAKRFRREAEVAASLRSPHTVELYDFGVTEDRTYYFVMELLEGLDLEHLVQEFGPIPAERVLHILQQVCASLSEAHSRGLVHRDIKPANIHLGRLGLEHDFVKVLDFGLVKSVASTTGEHSLTGVGLTPGTPAYMAPETALGDEVDSRADLYSLGCVAYYLLTAKVVFEGTSPLHVITRHVQDEPIPPSQRTEMKIPPALESLILACLGKKPDDRPQRASELARRLADVPLAERWTEDRAAQWWRVNRPYGTAT